MLAGVLTVAASFALAVPLRHISALRGRDEHAMVARDDNLVVRDVFQALYARELADLDASTMGTTAFLLKRNDNPPNTNAHPPNTPPSGPPTPESPPPAYPDTPPPPDYRHHVGAEVQGTQLPAYLPAPPAYPEDERPPTGAAEATAGHTGAAGAPAGHTAAAGQGGAAARQPGTEEEKSPVVPMHRRP
ncbi:hypothetical protein EIP91_007350 [Steccherinum ochraceum]|uniref:Uncharacterized protein n=1 Tax=Steccherinum ochraceum TaxID=92696 RepID=A0A4R0RVE0_9APHY|nr:hypothetical protein EIP91_007350 [Steccherinum ochraceum]